MAFLKSIGENAQRCATRKRESERRGWEREGEMEKERVWALVCVCARVCGQTCVCERTNSADRGYSLFRGNKCARPRALSSEREENERV